MALTLLTACSDDSTPVSPGVTYRFDFSLSDQPATRLRLLIRQGGSVVAEWAGTPGESCQFDLSFSEAIEVLALAYDDEGHLLAYAQEHLSGALQGDFTLHLGTLPAQDGFAMPPTPPDLLYPLVRWSLKDYDGVTDENGIPMNAFVWSVPGPVYHPLYVAQIAIAKHSAYITGEGEHYRDEFLFLVDWLVSVAVNDPAGYSYWTYNFPFLWVYLDFQPPWYSGLAQGEVISALLRAHDLTAEASYRDLADRGMLVFHRTCDQHGGMSAVDRLGYHTPEEYPGQPSNHVLNGMILTLFGILDHYQITGDPQSELLYRRAIRYLEDRLFIYDTGYWSLYDTYRTEDDPGALVSENYHQLHIDLLDILHEQTGLPIFLEYADRFRSYQ